MFTGLRSAVHARRGEDDDAAHLHEELARLQLEVAELRGTTAQLQSDVQQARRLHRRLAELADVVEHALMVKLDEPAASPATTSVDDHRVL